LWYRLTGTVVEAECRLTIRLRYKTGYYQVEPIEELRYDR